MTSIIFRGDYLYIQAQEAFMVDKQLVDGAGEFVVKLSRLDNLRIPFVTSFLELLFPKEFGRNAKRKSQLPHIVKYQVYLLKSGGKPIETGSFRAKDFFGLHDTNYIFENDETNDHVRDLYHHDFISQDEIDTQQAQEHAKCQKQKPFKRLMNVIKFVGFIGFFYVLYLLWSQFIFADKSSVKQASTLTPSSNISSTGQQTSSIQDKTTIASQAPQASPEPPKLSIQYRLIGYLSTGASFSRFIIKDMQTGQLIYLTSDYAYKGLNTTIIYQDQLVTYFSGVNNATQSENQSNFFQFR